MRIPLGWLKDFVPYTLSPSELADRLTMIGLEVEGVDSVHGDTVFEVNVTPNRPDCLSIIGIAREVAAMLDLPLTLPEYEIPDEAGDCEVKVEIIDEDLCRRYAGRAIRDVTIQESPDWMKKRIEQCGMRAINNIVDITNYLLLEMGHPLHAFDMETIDGKVICVKKALPSSVIKTLDGSDRSLPDDALLIWDGVRPVAIAGVMGGHETEVTGKTTQVFLESAYFLPQSVRRTSRLLGLKTESAYRFERGADIEMLEKALDRAALLMGRLAGGKVSKKVDAYPRPFTPPSITVRYDRVNKIIGTSLPRDLITDIVQRLGITVRKEPECFTAIPPAHRTDIQREIDIIEEVARCYGYDKIPVTVPKMHVSRETKDRTYSRIAKVKETMRASGFAEVVNYSFMNPALLDTLLVPDGDPRRKAVVIRNPLNVEESLMRTFIAPSLLQNLVLNVSMGTRDLRLFEASRVFRDKGEPLPEEVHTLGAVSFREKTPALWKEEAPGFYLMKGALEGLLDILRIEGFSHQRSSEPFLHPGQSSDVIIAGEKAGFIGVLHPDITEGLSLKSARPEIVVMEMDLERLLAAAPKTITYRALPRFPYIDRDIAILVDESSAAGALMEKIRSFPSDLLEDVFIFDAYKGKNIPAGKKSLAFSIRYRSKERTLTDLEIEELHGRLVAYLVEQTGGVIRGTSA